MATLLFRHNSAEIDFPREKNVRNAAASFDKTFRHESEKNRVVSGVVLTATSQIEVRQQRRPERVRVVVVVAATAGVVLPVDVVGVVLPVDVVGVVLPVDVVGVTSDGREVRMRVGLLAARVVEAQVGHGHPDVGAAVVRAGKVGQQ
jgi:hypothetical protein